MQAASVVLNVFLLGAVSKTAWARFGIWIAATLVVYFLYSLPSSFLHSRSRYRRQTTPFSLSCCGASHTILRKPATEKLNVSA